MLKFVDGVQLKFQENLKQQLKAEFGKVFLKKLKLINCVLVVEVQHMGFWSEFIDYNKKQIELIGVEAGGPKNSRLHAAPLSIRC